MVCELRVDKEVGIVIGIRIGRLDEEVIIDEGLYVTGEDRGAEDNGFGAMRPDLTTFDMSDIELVEIERCALFFNGVDVPAVETKE